MTKLAISAVAALFAFCHPLRAQIPDPFLFNSSPLNRSFAGLPAITLADQDRVSFLGALSWQMPTEYLPAFNRVEPRSASSAVKSIPRNTSVETAEFKPASPIYVGGEIGFLYGRTTGKYGYEYEQGYIIGEIGTDNVHLTVGMSHERINWRLPNR
jgi:hypothetical protein